MLLHTLSVKLAQLQAPIM